MKSTGTISTDSKGHSKKAFLLWKFALVAMMVGLAIASLTMGNGLKYGPDIAGGYSMVFEVENPEGQSDMVQRVIAILKKRIDPTGLSSIEWRPLGKNRFEVRMPAASKSSQELRNKYVEARKVLLDRNIHRSDLPKFLAVTGDARLEAIRARVGDNEVQIQNVENVLKVMQAQALAEAALTKLIAADETATGDPTPEEQATLIAAQKAVQTAGMGYRLAYDKVRAANLSPHRLQAVLKLYNDAQAQLAENPDTARAMRATYESQLGKLHKDYAGYKAGIDTVIGVYTKWSDVKKPLEDPADLIRLIRKAGVLEFRIAIPRPQLATEERDRLITQAQADTFLKSLIEDGPNALIDSGADFGWFPIRADEESFGRFVTGDYAGSTYILLSNRAGEKMVQATGDETKWQLASARVGSDGMMAPAVNFTFDEVGARLFLALTSSNIGKAMAITLDDEVYSAPNINSAISGRGQITGSFTLEEVRDLVRILEAGSLPGKVNPEPISQRSFGAAIGSVNMQKGLRAAIIGLIVVASFMMVYYLLCGAIADVALLLNLILVIGAMSLFQAVLTLPGIAGLILTIGMAVDANVLIFERLREEQDKGLGLRQAVKNAYERAFTAIIDANITTLLICLFLFVVFDWVGMEEVRGFAVTLGLGVAFSMFTALVVTRWVFTLLMDWKVITKPLPMLRLIPKVNVNWIQKRYMFWGISIALMVMGITSLIWQGSGILGIEFSAGTQAVIKFQETALVKDAAGNEVLLNDDLVRAAIESKAKALRDVAETEEQRKALDNFIATARVETLKNENKVRDFLKLYAPSQDKVEASSDIWKKHSAFFALLDSDGDKVVTEAELKANLPETSYQMSTTCRDAKIVRNVIRGAFAQVLQGRQALAFGPRDKAGTSADTLAMGATIPALGGKLADDGLTVVTSARIDASAGAVQNEMEDYKGGLLMVVQGVTPAATVSDVQERIRDVRMLPDFGRSEGNEFTVLGLTAASGGESGYTSFAILVRTANGEALDGSESSREFAASEKELLITALQRKDSMTLTNFDPAIAGQTGQLAIVVVILSWLAIVAYLWLRFGSVQWGLAAVICLIHDVVIVVGLIAASGWLVNTAFGELLGITSFKIDLAIVAAILTVIGYSVNDTIVVFDRIRENRGKLKTVTGQCINASINQTLPRTLLTSFTTFLVVLIMYIWGGPGIKAFNFALLAGILFGTYSSVAVASPLLLGFKQALIAKVIKEEDEPQV